MCSLCQNFLGHAQNVLGTKNSNYKLTFWTMLKLFVPESRRKNISFLLSKTILVAVKCLHYIEFFAAHKPLAWPEKFWQRHASGELVLKVVLPICFSCVSNGSPWPKKNVPLIRGQRATEERRATARVRGEGTWS